MLTTRLATADDVPAITALIDSAYESWIPVLGGRKPRPMLDDHAARVARGENWLVEDDAALLGVIALVPAAEALHIFSIAIAPDAQGRGVLRHLLAFAEDLARRSQLGKLTLYTNELMQRNREIYAHLGFIQTGVEEAVGYRIVFMERPVRALKV